ncbi:glycosyltransferase [Nostoc sp. 'Peltigera malacea cyanobiont' DB3992]|uniref:glycosyltransferase n=1 Tax=Nostoc sp. 'Peltigera malacea cyanobiont' DB3992 TaxID=1206980 RepID=UPI00211E13D2|nr:glycosyltransferase [Nostoc sp. 'Peltigera malacea cyanobiont' DB3992]
MFVNDCSPDNSEEVVQKISRIDKRVIGISHSRNFGSQAAFKSGMEIATKNACVLLDGDLQDLPELIEQFVEKWREGYDVVYGRRKKRKLLFLCSLPIKLSTEFFDYFSYLSIPHDAGDFS